MVDNSYDLVRPLFHTEIQYGLRRERISGIKEIDAVETAGRVTEEILWRKEGCLVAGGVSKCKRSDTVILKKRKKTFRWSGQMSLDEHGCQNSKGTA